MSEQENAPVPRTSAYKIPPYSVASEKVVLGSLLRDPTLVDRIRSIVPDPNVFFRPEHVRLYAAIGDACSGGAAPSSDDLVKTLAAAGADETKKYVELRKIRDAAVDVDETIRQAKVVADKARLRDLIAVVSDILHDTWYRDDGFETVLNRALSRLEQLQSADRPRVRPDPVAPPRSGR